MKEIETFQTVIIPISFATQASIQTNVNVDFTPDEMILKHISLADASFNSYCPSGIFIIQSNLVPLQTLFSHVESITAFSEFVSIHYPIRQEVRGNFNFNIVDSLKNALTRVDTINLNIAMTVTFIKYKKSN